MCAKVCFQPRVCVKVFTYHHEGTTSSVFVCVPVSMSECLFLPLCACIMRMCIAVCKFLGACACACIAVCVPVLQSMLSELEGLITAIGGSIRVN